tara:strand:- start:98 stop:622 length:525 start_codon:yes stop_codon:yes gene_type:complete
MKRVILVGFMGSGKTTLGKKLSNSMGVKFIDSDKEIELKYKKTIGVLFGEKGETGFREIETEFIEELKNQEEFVLATGGGMPCFNHAMERLNAIGCTFYLERTSKELAHRLINAKSKRPLIDGLNDKDLLDFIVERLNDRKSFYKSANVTLNREEQNVESISKIILLLDQAQKS